VSGRLSLDSIKLTIRLLKLYEKQLPELSA